MKKQKKKEKKKKEVKEKLIRDNKGSKRFFRIIVWTLIGFLLLRGAASLINNDSLEVQALGEELKAYMKNPPEQLETLPIVEGTAKSYLREYLTFNGNKNERDKRLNEISEFRINENFESNIISTTPLGIEVYEAELINENEVNVNLLARVEVKKYSDEENDQGKKKITSKVISSYYRVTVLRDAIGATIKKEPIVLPVPDQAELNNVRALNYASVERDEKKEIEESLNSFFKAYFEGTMKDISYVTTLKDLKGLEDLYKFLKIEKLDIRMNEQNELFATVSIKLTNEIKTFITGYEMTLIREEEKYLVTSFDVTNKNFETHYSKEENE